jgi:hypothetical protein
VRSWSKDPAGGQLDYWLAGAGIDDPGDKLKDPEPQNKASGGVGTSVGHQWVLKTGR